MITALDHIAISVADLEESIRRFADDFGLDFEGQEDVVPAQTTTAFFPIAGTRIELVHPLDGKGPIASALERRGPGLHHLCFRTDDLLADMERLRERGYRLLSEEPQVGAHDSRVVFIHPRSTGGVLIELVEHAEGSHE